jgi:hypothetical protein
VSPRTALARLDALLEREVRRLRLRYQLTLDEFRGLYVSDEQIDALLATSDGGEQQPWHAPPLAGGPVWSRLAARFDLSPLAQDVLLLAAAPDLDPKYAPIIAYLNDDVSARWPTFDLARRLFAAAPDREPELALVLSANGPLFGNRLIAPVTNGGQRRPTPLAGFAAAPAIAEHLLGRPPRLAQGLRLIRERHGVDAVQPQLAGLAPLLTSAEARPLILLQGEWGSGRGAAATELASTLGWATLRVDLKALQAADGHVSVRLDEAILLARLNDAALLIVADDAEIDPALARMAHAPVPVFVTVPTDGRWGAALRHVPLAAIPFALPDLAQRRRLWDDALAREGLVADGQAIDAAANRFRLTPRRIAEAAVAARIAARVPCGKSAAIESPLLLSAARSHAALDLGALATPVTADYRWSDLVLPPPALRQLRELAEAIVNRDRVLREWGFTRGGASGLAALFGGSSGTGKTMSATVIARETGLDLWRIDLSAVVSKYIGQTEKHLERIFTAARDGNAILFFDEADALFGQRSEVKDAHDRYANIEVAFLLQRLETHDGVSILATNLAKNVDPAFSRRMHTVIEFPLPDAAARERLWRGVFPSAVPLAPDIDFAFLAKQFAFAGGDIRVAALDAAFLAAAQEGAVTMRLLIQTVARQMLKQGKVPSAVDFRQYYPLLSGAPQRMSVV